MKSSIVWLLPLTLACDPSTDNPEPFGGTPAATDGAQTDDGSADDGNGNDGDDAGNEGPDDGADDGFGDGPDDGPDDGLDDDGPDDGVDDDGPDDGADDGTDDGGQANCYTEPLTPDANIDDIVGSYGGGGYQAQVIEAMDRRWPAGAFLLQAQADDPYWSQFSDPNSWSGMVGWLDTLVHEQTHLFNAYHAIEVGELAALYFREDKILYLPNDQGFPRSEILPHLIPEAASGNYASLYLTGTQGQRLFHPLLDETNCYANEIPGLAVFGEYFGGFGLSLRDGSAAFLYFLEVYLRVGRTQHPDWYAWAQTQDVYLEAVELLWLRTHFFYEAVGDGYPELGISDDLYRQEAYQPDNLAELEMFTGKTFDDSSCVVQ